MVLNKMSSAKIFKFLKNYSGFGQLPKTHSGGKSLAGKTFNYSIGLRSRASPESECNHG